MTPDGIINIYKEQNMTSHDVVGRVRHILGVRRVGHTGTLDPMATGVLPVCIGRSARVMEYLDTDLKKYRCVMKLGRATNTYDVWGEVQAESSPEAVNKIRPSDVMAVLSGFRGRITQLPPLYSAVKVNGKRLYEYARKGRDVEIPSREIYVTSLEIEDMELGKGYDSWVRFSCECTKGTFIRSICHEAGEKLMAAGENGEKIPVHACLSELERTASGIFTEDDAVSLDELKKLCHYDDKAERKNSAEHTKGAQANSDGVLGMLKPPDAVLGMLKPPDAVLGMFGRVTMDKKDALRLINGLEIERSVYRVEEEPRYKEQDFYFPVRDEYRRLYRVYSRFTDDDVIPGRPNGVSWYGDDELKFIGLALMNEENGHLFPEKIFI